MPSTQIEGSKLGITIVVLAAALMAMIDITIVNVALSDIRASFGTPIDQIGWVSTGYMMANIVVIPMTGWLQRRFGYKRYFAASVVLFSVASALCGISRSLTQLVLFRALQGLGGGAIIPTAQSILFARYPRSEHGMAAALFGLGAVSGPLLGPTIGGYLIEWSSWHWIFIVNVPIGIAVVALAWRFIEQPGWQAPKGEEARVDFAGIALLAVGMASLQYVLEEGNREGWQSTHVLVLAAVALISLVTLIVHELETPHAVLDLRVFRNRNYAAGTGLNFLTGFALFSGSYMFSLYAGAVIHYTALDTGKVFLVAGLISLLVMPLIGKLGPKVDGRLLLLIGVSAISFSQWTASSLTASAGFWDMVKPNLMRSFGLGFVFIPVSMLALSDVAPEQRGNATGLFNLTRELGGSVGTALMGVVLSDDIKRHTAYLSERIDAYNPLAQEQLRALGSGAAGRPWGSQLVAESLLSLKVSMQAMVLSFESGFRWVALVMALGLLLIAVIQKPRVSAPVPGAH